MCRDSYFKVGVEGRRRDKTTEMNDPLPPRIYLILHGTGPVSASVSVQFLLCVARLVCSGGYEMGPRSKVQ